MNTDPPAETMVIPGEQLLEGWFLRRGVVLERRPHSVIRVLPCGNYLVRNPARIVYDERRPAGAATGQPAAAE